MHHVINPVVCDFVILMLSQNHKRRKRRDMKLLLKKLPVKKRISQRKNNITSRDEPNNINRREINIEIEEENTDEIIEDYIIDNKNTNHESPLQKLRYLIKKVRSSSYHFSFQKICESSSLECNTINLDCVTRWSSTYL